jgi:hypothetical protein
MVIAIVFVINQGNWANSPRYGWTATTSDFNNYYIILYCVILIEQLDRNI